MALLPKEPRQQRLLMVGLLAAGLAFVYQQYLWKPKNDILDLTAKRVEFLDSLNNKTKIEVAKGTAGKIRAEADMYQRQLEGMRRLVPTQNEVPALLDAVSESARRAGLELAGFDPDGVIAGDQFDTYRFKIGVMGPYHQLAAFLANVGSLQRIVAPINLNLVPSTRVSERRVKKDEQLLEARMQIQTYVVHTAPPPAAGAGAK